MRFRKAKNLFAIIFALMATSALTVTADKGSKKDVPTASHKASVGKLAPGFTLVDAVGKKHSLSDYKGKYVVLEWINFGCPFVRKHYGSGNMQKLQAKYTKKDVVWLSICSSASGKEGFFEGDALLAQIKKAHTHASAYLIDADGTVGHLYNARTTPNMYIINPEGELIYAGAIDDKPSTNQNDIKGAVNYVDAALVSAFAGEKIAHSKSVPYGCSVKY